MGRLVPFVQETALAGWAQTFGGTALGTGRLDGGRLDGGRR